MSLNVLIVDDSVTIRTVIAKAIGLSNAPVNEIQFASNGQEALNILNKSFVDLVLADINMPVMNGVEMVEQMQSQDHLKKIPVVVVSTEGSSTRIEDLKSKGVKAFIRKPFTPESICQVILEATNANRPDAEQGRKAPQAGEVPRTDADRKRVIGDVFESVLQNLAFMFVESVDKDTLRSTDSPHDMPENFTKASMAFSGPIQGRVNLMVPDELAKELAANIIGKELDRNISQKHLQDALKEVLNVTCGNLLSAVVGSTQVFDAAPPTLTEHDEAGWSAFLEEPASIPFMIEDWPALLQFLVEERNT
ncbi:MAG: response regulator [Gemmatimonadota bacterium]